MKAEKNKKTGKWDIQYRYTDWQGIRRKSMKRGFDTKREAEEWLREFLSVKAVDFNMLFEDFVNDIYYKDQATRLREHTMENKHYIIDLKILPYFGRKKMNEIKAGDIRKWQNMMISKGYAPTYLKTMNNQLSAIFNFAEKYYDLSTNPCKKAGSMKDMFSHISHASGVSMTSIILPMFLTRIVVKISVMIGKITKKEP